MVSAVLNPATQDRGSGMRGAVFAVVILCCGLLALIALIRTGIRIFWSGGQRQPPVVRAAEALPIMALLALCGALTVAAGPAMSLAQAAARSLRGREYVDAVLQANASGSPTTPKGLRESPR
jgi:multicomponent K+:H+ antiporter subunit D